MSLDGVQIALNFPNALYSIPSTTKSAIGYYVKSPPSFNSSFIRYGNKAQVVSSTVPHKTIIILERKRDSPNTELKNLNPLAAK